MKIALKWVLRLVASLTGLLGVFSLFFTWRFALDGGPLIELIVSLPFLVFLLTIYFYLIFVAYLAWFRFSPRAVRHISAVLVLMGYLYLWDNPRERVFGDLADENPWYGYFMIGGLFAGFWAWVFLDGLLNRILFPVAPVTALSNGQNESQSANEIDDQRATRP